MKSLDHCVEQLRTNRATLLLVSMTAGTLIGTAVAIHFLKGVPIGYLMRDPVVTLHGKFYTGLLSQAGIFFWAATAATCLFAAHMMASWTSTPRFKGFFTVFGIISLLLGLDDVFLLHEEVFPHIGIREEVVFVGYAGISLVSLFAFRSLILTTDYLLLVAAACFFGASLTIDEIDGLIDLDRYIRARILFEDGAKLVGLLFWFAYFFRSAAFAIHSNTGQYEAVSDDHAAPLN